jgi:predicted SAM-dependent methyltransferase
LISAASVLDVGAGDRRWKSVLERLGIGAAYASVDVESRHKHDFDDFLAVNLPVDAILMLELLEHLSVDVGLQFLDHAATLLRPGGALVIGTPNTEHPHWFWSADFTHIRPWPARDLWAILRIAGFEEVEIYRQMLTSTKRSAMMPLQAGISRLLGIDPAQGLLVFGTKRD